MSEIDNKPILLSPVELNDVNHHQFQQPQFCCPPMGTLNFFEGHHNSQIMLPNQTNSSSSSSCTSSPINAPTSLITINTSSINNANVAPNSILIRQFPSPPT
ncbi:13826_t:CDS:2, partial [Entrophospora sp. SA101]